MTDSAVLEDGASNSNSYQKECRSTSFHSKCDSYSMEVIYRCY